MAGSQVTVALTQIEKQRLGYQAISLTNFGNDSEPEIAAGSKVEIGGALFEFPLESITGWAGIGNNQNVYIKLVVAGLDVTAEFTIVAPTWSTSKQGFYDGLDRYIGGLYKDASGNYTTKYLFGREQEGKIAGADGLSKIEDGIFWKNKKVDIGNWDMDTNASVDVTIDVESEKVRGIDVIIRNDTPGATYPLNKYNLSAGEIEGGVEYLTASAPWQVRLSRRTGGYFNNSNFNATPYNRGWITVWYDPNG